METKAQPFIAMKDIISRYLVSRGRPLQSIIIACDDGRGLKLLRGSIVNLFVCIELREKVLI